ncbi:MAG: phage virion morphogenesis protein [Deltaproteobacteria bacterium]|nr:phage virion morphogenesis protein [Deltaproteobacteria bacterium]
MNAIRCEGWDTLAALRERMGRTRAALSAPGGLYRRLEALLSGWLAENFDTQGGLLEGPAGHWPPLARSTIAARRRQGRGLRPLEATGRLRRGLRAWSDEGGVTLENPVPYAAAHQLGQGVPRRAFLPGAAQAGRLAYPELERFVREALR